MPTIYYAVTSSMEVIPPMKVPVEVPDTTRGTVISSVKQLTAREHGAEMYFISGKADAPDLLPCDSSRV